MSYVVMSHIVGLVDCIMNCQPLCVLFFFFHCFKSTGHCRCSQAAGGATVPNFTCYFAQSVKYCAGVRHSWQSFGLAGRIVRALASVPLGVD